jgi:hypothetical protein
MERWGNTGETQSLQLAVSSCQFKHDRLGLRLIWDVNYTIKIIRRRCIQPQSCVRLMSKLSISFCLHL